MAKLFDIEPVVSQLGIADLGRATIGQAMQLAERLEVRTGIPFIRMDQGVPGLEACAIGIEAEKAALDRGVAAIYPPPEGIPEVKTAASDFIKAFLDSDISPAGCIPVCGSAEGSFGAFAAAVRIDPAKDTILFIDPGFPVQKEQLDILKINYITFDIYGFRGEKLRPKLEEYLSEKKIAAIVYSNPNNPTWACLEEAELEIIGELATRHGAIVIEDLAYLGMDFRRQGLGTPGVPPYQVTIAHYTARYILLLSASKIFSYAGQRAGIVAVSDALFPQIGNQLIHNILYMITSGVAHSVQHGLAAMLRAAVDGRIDFVETTREYARRAREMKRLFLQNGFHIVYDRDATESVGDGFFFTIGYKKLSSSQLMSALFAHGISAIPLSATGSRQEGVRACSARLSTPEQFALLEERLEAFNTDRI